MQKVQYPIKTKKASSEEESLKFTKYIDKRKKAVYNNNREVTDDGYFLTVKIIKNKPPYVEVRRFISFYCEDLRT